MNTNTSVFPTVLLVECDGERIYTTLRTIQNVIADTAGIEATKRNLAFSGTTQSDGVIERNL
ncbi:Uncharacterised protein [Yersinia pseudotuberculosis]|nr:Uncharacterised protein [Yersinia similis]CNK23841.1 Uncharacterised protein [Yersinia pseudotuberculosis]CRY70847.1 Uncharacterised protein [Yersinia pseudotuberculosis]SUQ18077.1 Uncharacterised protein [Yersinia pseudotuberculosis]VEE71564.1 Uncharacterised protein [Yersinia pseudotuberculosis]